MRPPLEVHFAPVEVIAQDTHYNFVMDAQRRCDLFLRYLSLAFDQLTASVHFSSVTRPLEPGQLDALAIEGTGALLDGRQQDHILAINFLEFGEDYLVGAMLEP
jgi:hypothetical protein